MWWLILIKFIAAGIAVFAKYFVNLFFDILEYFEKKMDSKK